MTLHIRERRQVTTIEVVQCEINQPVADSNLNAVFPEGAKVFESRTMQHHIWGKNGPSKSFESMEALMEYLENLKKKS